jgi:hypothetical protein
LNELREEQLIYDSSTRTKSIHLSPAGEEAAKKLVKKYIQKSNE